MIETPYTAQICDPTHVATALLLSQGAMKLSVSAIGAVCEAPERVCERCAQPQRATEGVRVRAHMSCQLREARESGSCC